MPHGEDVYNAQKKESGIGDTELTEKGKDFAKQMCHYVKSHPINKIILL